MTFVNPVLAHFAAHWKAAAAAQVKKLTYINSVSSFSELRVTLAVG